MSEAFAKPVKCPRCGFRTTDEFLCAPCRKAARQAEENAQ